jgi:hypothetical protein
MTTANKEVKGKAPAKPASKRGMISAGILSQIGTIGQATDELSVSLPGDQKQVKPAAAPKRPQGRPSRRPPCGKLTVELPQDLLDKLTAEAWDRTGGNRTMLIERILRGETTLELPAAK